MKMMSIVDEARLAFSIIDRSIFGYFIDRENFLSHYDVKYLPRWFKRTEISLYRYGKLKIKQTWKFPVTKYQRDREGEREIYLYKIVCSARLGIINSTLLHSSFRASLADTFSSILNQRFILVTRQKHFLYK